MKHLLIQNYSNISTPTSHSKQAEVTSFGNNYKKERNL